jgi:hypothetical protein
MSSTCPCNIGPDIAAEVSITNVSKTKSFNINLDNILKNITSSKSTICKPACKTQNVSEKKCTVNTEPVKSCSEYDHWYVPDVFLTECQTENETAELYNDAKHLVCSVVEVPTVIENAGCSVLDVAQKGFCDMILDIENDFQLIVSGTWYSFEEATLATGGDSVGGGIAFHIETITLKSSGSNIIIKNPLGKNPILIDCALEVGGDGFGPNCAICKSIPNTSINETDGNINFSLGNITLSVCITLTGPVINVQASAGVTVHSDPSIGFAGLVSFGIDIPVF